MALWARFLMGSPFPFPAQRRGSRETLRDEADATCGGAADAALADEAGEGVAEGRGAHAAGGAQRRDGQGLGGLGERRDVGGLGPLDDNESVTLPSVGPAVGRRQAHRIPLTREDETNDGTHTFAGPGRARAGARGWRRVEAERQRFMRRHRRCQWPGWASSALSQAKRRAPSRCMRPRVRTAAD